MDLLLFLGGIFLFTFLIGILLEKIRIPWIFAALILGLGLAFKNPFPQVTNSETFGFLGELGMYFLLFLIGFELDFLKIRQLGRFIIKATFLIIFLEAIFGSLVIHFIFGYSWFISVLIALSFATVGEAILIPILDEFNLTKTKLGQSILGIGTLDDIIEVLVIILVVASLPFLTGDEKGSGLYSSQILVISGFLIALFLFSFILIRLKKRFSLMKIPKIEAIFLLILAIFFLFLGFGKMVEATITAIGALLAGITVRNLLSKERIEIIEPYMKAVTYSLFGPIFFLWVGIDADVNYLIQSPLLILLVISVSYFAKILASYLVARRELGKRLAFLMGVALGVRFSTSIVIIKLLFEKGIMESRLYSVLIGSTIAFKFIIPFLLSFLITRWRISLLTRASK